jgi:hypothetical protein
VPATLPEKVQENDTELLLGHTQRTGSQNRISIKSVVHASLKTGLSPASVAERMRAYSLDAPIGPYPPHSDKLDVELLRYLPANEAIGQPHRKEILLYRVVDYSVEHGIAPPVVVQRLREYGVMMQSPSIPSTLQREDRNLVYHFDDAMYSHGIGEPVAWDRPMPLHHLIRLASKMFTSLQDVGNRAAEFGFQVPWREIEEADEVDRQLCLDEYRLGGDKILLPLLFEDPIGDYLRIVRYSGMSQDELLVRLTRLGVDVGSTVRAIHAALPKVPGLVWQDADPAAGEGDG